MTIGDEEFGRDHGEEEVSRNTFLRTPSTRTLYDENSYKIYKDFGFCVLLHMTKCELNFNIKTRPLQ